MIQLMRLTEEGNEQHTKSDDFDHDDAQQLARGSTCRKWVHPSRAGTPYLYPIEFLLAVQAVLETLTGPEVYQGWQSGATGEKGD